MVETVVAISLEIGLAVAYGCKEVDRLEFG